MLAKKLITGCAKRKGAYMKAKKYLSEMLSKGLKPDSFVYASALHVYASSGMEEEARSLFEQMQADGIKPVKFHYASLLSMYAEKKRTEEAEALFQQFQESGLPLDEVQ
jgi:pentatricopeptide repeat protein